jgi:hypothetical protein
MNAIVTAATGYNEEHLRIFLWSVEKNCKDTLVFLIVYRRDRKVIEKLQDKYPFIRPVYISAFIRKQISRLANHRTRPIVTWLASQISQWQYSSLPHWIRLPIQLAIRIVHERYFIALQILESHPNAFANVLLTDCRDVVIQQDPFNYLEGQLISGLEAKVIKDESYTSSWIKTAYGSDFLHTVEDKSVICAGVTLGSAQKVKDYLTALCNEMWVHLPQMVFKDVGYDQAAHIYLIYQNQINLELSSNHQGKISSLNNENPQCFDVDSTNELVKIYNQYPAIIHQYDRHPKLLHFFTDLVAQGTTP